MSQVVDPLDLFRVLWPDVQFFNKQKEIIYSVRDNPETVVVAANQVGKDFTAAAIALWFFLAHKEVRIVVTSVKDDHLRVFFGELERFIQTSKYPLLCQRKRDRMLGYTHKFGGPLWLNHRDIRKYVDSKLCPISYLRGMVSETGEGMQGHHTPSGDTLGIIDESSGVRDEVYNAMTTWARRILIFGNPLPADNNFFERAVKTGDIPLTIN